METIEYNGCTIDVEYDEDAGCPFTEWDQMSTLVYLENGYMRSSMPYGTGAERINLEYSETTEEAITDHFNGERIGVMLSFRIDDYGSRGWTVSHGTPGMPDERDNAFLYVSRDTLLKEYSSKILTASVKKQALDVLKSELDVYRSWLNGDVYGYIAKDADGHEIESVWGFYGDKEYMLTEAKSAIDGHLSRMADKHSLALAAGL